MKKLEILTADSCRVGECLVDAWVHLNIQIFLNGQRAVSVVDSITDPVSKWLTDHGSCHIGYPLFRETEKLLSFLRVVLKAIGMLIEKLKNMLNCK